VGLGLFFYKHIWPSPFLTKTKLGTAIRAASYDMTIASLNGVNMSRLISVVFILAGSFAGLAGIF